MNPLSGTPLSCISMNNQECKVRLEIINFNSDDTISLSCHEQVCLSGLSFERYFSHHWAM